MKIERIIEKVESNESYHEERNHISSSVLKKIYSTTVKHFLAQRFKPTSSMNFGTAVHTAILEPQLFDKEIFVTKKIDRRSKEGKMLYQQQIELSRGKTMISEDDMLRIEEIKRVLYEKDESGNYYNQYILNYLEGKKEHSYYVYADGNNFKVRPDCFNLDKKFISDIKTTQSTNPYKFRSQCYQYYWHLQAVVYSDYLGVPPENFRFIAIESEIVEHSDGSRIPFADIQLFSLDEKMIESGRLAYQQAFAKWKYYLKHGRCSGYVTENINENDLSIIMSGYGKN